MSMLSIATRCGASKEKPRPQCTPQTSLSTGLPAGPLPVRASRGKKATPVWQTGHAGAMPIPHSGRTEAASRERKLFPLSPPGTAAGAPLTLPFPHSITVAASEKSGNVKGLNTASVTTFPGFAHFSTDGGVSDSLPFQERRQSLGLLTSLAVSNSEHP